MKTTVSLFRRVISAALLLSLCLTALCACEPATIEPGTVEQAPVPETFDVELPAELFVSESFACDRADAVLVSSPSDIISCSDCTITALAVGTAQVDCCGNVHTVEVTDDIPESLGGVIERICEEKASADALAELDSLRERLTNCTSDDAAQASVFIDELNSFAADGGDAAALAAMLPDEALPDGADRDACAPRLRYAAECMHARSQMSENSAVLTFTGDCTFGRFNEQNADFQFPLVYENSGSVSYPFDGVRHWLELDDLTVINFEGTLTDYDRHAKKQFYFRGKKEYADILPSSSVEVACLANNHVYDYCEQGFADTVDALTDKKVLVSSAEEPVVTTLNGIETVIITGGPMLYNGQMLECIDYLRDGVKQYKRDDNIVIVCLHWGIEYDEYPSFWQTDLAHELIDLGADAIIGHHPHIIQGIEEYNGRIIAYSLGNFAFGGNYTTSNPETFMLRLVLSRTDGPARISEWSIVPCRISSHKSYNDYRPVPLTGREAKDVVSLLLERSTGLKGGIKAVDYMK